MTNSNEEDLETLKIGRERLNGEFSKLALALHLAELKVIYDRTYDAGPGGDRTKQKENSSFCEFIAETGVMGARSVGNYARQGKAILRMSEKVRDNVRGTALANQLGILERIAKVDSEHHCRLVEAFRADRKKGNRLLGKLAPVTSKTSKDAILAHEANDTLEEPSSDPAPASFAKSGQLEGPLKKTRDGFVGEFDLDGKVLRLVVSKNCKTFVVVDADQGPKEPLPSIAKAKHRSPTGPLTGKKLSDAIREIAEEAGPPKRQPHGLDVIFMLAGRKWTLSWWSAEASSKIIEVTHISEEESIATIKGPWIVADFSRRFSARMKQLERTGT